MFYTSTPSYTPVIVTLCTSYDALLFTAVEVISFQQEGTTSTVSLNYDNHNEIIAEIADGGAGAEQRSAQASGSSALNDKTAGTHIPHEAPCPTLPAAAVSISPAATAAEPVDYTLYYGEMMTNEEKQV